MSGRKEWAAVLAMACASSGAWAQAWGPPAFEPARVVHEAGAREGRCLGVRAGAALLAPSHCLSPDGTAREEGGGARWRAEAVSRARDYALLKPEAALDGQAAGVGRESWPTAPARAGEAVAIRLRHGWALGRVEALSAGGFWASARECVRPGDSGAAVWAKRSGRWEWLGMLVSGQEGEGAREGCHERFSAVSAQSIAWGVERP